MKMTLLLFKYKEIIGFHLIEEKKTLQINYCTAMHFYENDIIFIQIQRN